MPSLTCPRVASLLAPMQLLQQFKDRPQHLLAWSLAYLDLMVLMALVDGEMSPDEESLITLLSEYVPDVTEASEAAERAGEPAIESPHIRVVQIVEAVRASGVERVIPIVVGRVRGLVQQLRPTERRTVVSKLLEGVLDMVTADRQVRESERAFLLGELAPALGVEQKHVLSLLAQTERTLIQRQLYSEALFEIYLALNDADTDLPPVTTDDVTGLTGLPRKMAALMVKHQLRSPYALSYVLTTVAGLSSIDVYEHHLMHLEDLVVTYRALRALRGTPTRMTQMTKKLERLGRDGMDTDATSRVAGHVTAVLGKMDRLGEQARAVLHKEIAPPLSINMVELLRTAQAIEGINSALLDNLTGVDSGVRRFGRWKDYWAATTN